MAVPNIQQTIRIGSNGADSRRVLDALTPINNTTGPAINATYLGQIYIDTATSTVYISIAVGSVVPSTDWLEIAAAVG